MQRAHDRQPPVEWTLWQARTRAVDEAREAVEAGEADDAPLRAALVDVASVCVELASRLRTPTLAQRDTVAPIGCACGCAEPVPPGQRFASEDCKARLAAQARRRLWALARRATRSSDGGVVAAKSA